MVTAHFFPESIDDLLDRAVALSPDALAEILKTVAAPLTHLTDVAGRQAATAELADRVSAAILRRDKFLNCAVRATAALTGLSAESLLALIDEYEHTEEEEVWTTGAAVLTWPFASMLTSRLKFRLADDGKLPSRCIIFVDGHVAALVDGRFAGHIDDGARIRLVLEPGRRAPRPERAP